ncbi:TIGR03016 family PEP-CTERM system-associated outer membrane protein [Dechloromonas agitata]|uniref:TIGR03016 family PEP-CTERM system-associated outer membrane protein n=1 Tax=Dechloromonas agitata TaxID=73030 RepID=UPI00237D9725|nr:TIGR03016 family PEP-CTERM system-associated outer membrane protein [Dechloromonas agitata]MDE1546575.1 TIGR03016 family PEP-CTERM system-associated outer membrane protein [Dechloromonas agitata]
MDTATDMGPNMKLDRLFPAAHLAAMVAACCCAQSIQAQQISGSVLSESSTATGAQPAFLGGNNMGSGDGRAFIITPRITLSETWSDNVSLNAGSTRSKESGFITELAPGVRIDARTARLKAYFDYSLRGQFYSTPSGYSRTQNQLNTFGTLEAVSNWLYVDFSGIIAQQAISAFGSQSPGSANINNNTTETSTYRLSPYIRGQVAGVAEYLLRYNYSTTHANASIASDVDLSEWVGQLRGSTPFQSLRWALDASQQTAEYSYGRKTDSDRFTASATYIVVPQFRVTFSGGQEANNYASVDKESHTTHGYGFDWNPTERTQISAFRDKRFFGNGHRYSFTHRFPLSSISYSDTKDVSILPNQFTSVGMGTIYDLFRQILFSQLSSQYSDPIQLEAEVNRRLSQIPANILNTPRTSSFLSSRATIQRRQELALAIQGVRNTLTIMFNRNESDSMLASDSIQDDFYRNSVNSIKQRGVSISLAHQLSGLTTANLTASRQESTGTGTTALKATTTLYQGGISTKLGPKTTGSLNLRHSKFDSSTNPYTENAVIGMLSVLF